jgi:hypothetical protein
LFYVTFEGEAGIDWGGLMLDSINRMVVDLFSPQLTLMRLSPNGRRQDGMNTDKYLPNPSASHTTPNVLGMYNFVGRLMGTSLRHRFCLPFDFAPAVWKRLVRQPVGLQDIEEVDSSVAETLAAIRDCVSNGVTNQAQFAAAFPGVTWSIPRTDGHPMELVRGGASIAVTFATRMEFVQAAIAQWVRSFAVPIEAIRRGLLSVVPERAMRLLTWKELEILVAGRPEIDVDDLRKHTVYEGYDENDATIRHFWSVLRSITPEERTLFIRFAWGRSRLPITKKWPKNLKIQRAAMRPGALPESHTCFFAVELPPYETEAETRRALLTAIHFGLGGILNA